MPDRVDFGDCTPASAIIRQISISNRATFGAEVSLSVSGPFTLTGSNVVEIAGGAGVDVTISFTPTAPGPANGTLAAALEDGDVRSVLLGNGIADCADADSCIRSTFDTNLQRCIATTLADGNACNSRCVAHGQCASGRCYGDSVDCDDGNFCTIDACDESGACLHLPRSCPVTDPCQVAACDPVLGRCNSSDIDDGTSCGVADCGFARVCIAGSCVRRAKPGVDENLDCRYVDLALANGTACAVTRRGDVRCWGRAEPIVAAGARESSLELQPPVVIFDAGEQVAHVSLTAAVCAWGLSGGRCSGEALVPDRWPGLASARSVDVSQYGTCVVDRIGVLTCFDFTTGPAGMTIFDGGVLEARGGVRPGRAMMEDGGLTGWGTGLGPPSSPSPLIGPTDPVALPVFGCVIDARGGLWCQTGSPNRYELIVDAGVQTVARWGTRLCVAGDGGARCLPAEPLPWADVSKLAADNDSLCVLRSDGTVECIGGNSSGILGIETFYLPPATLLDGGPIGKISMSDQLTLFEQGPGLRIVRRSADAELPDLSALAARDFAVGGGDLGVIPASGSARRLVFVPQARPADPPGHWLDLPWSLLDGSRVAARSTSTAGSRHLALTEAGELRLYALAPLSEPLEMARMFGDADDLAFAGNRACGLRRDGGVDCVSLSSSDAGIEHVALPVAATAISMNATRECAVLAAGTLWCWDNSHPATIESGAPAFVRALAMGAEHECVVHGTNGVACRGSNRSGALGHAGVDSLAAWVPVPIGAPVSRITSGPNAASTCVHVQGGRAVCWGDNRMGQLGVEPLLQSLAPVRLGQ